MFAQRIFSRKKIGKSGKCFKSKRATSEGGGEKASMGKGRKKGI